MPIRFYRKVPLTVDAYTQRTLPNVPQRLIAIRRTGKTVAHVPPDVAYPELSGRFYDPANPDVWVEYPRSLHKLQSRHYPASNYDVEAGIAANRTDRRAANIILREMRDGKIDPDDVTFIRRTWWS